MTSKLFGWKNLVPRYWSILNVEYNSLCLKLDFIMGSWKVSTAVVYDGKALVECLNWMNESVKMLKLSLGLHIETINRVMKLLLSRNIETINWLKCWNCRSLWILELLIVWRVELMNRLEYWKFDLGAMLKLWMGLNMENLISLKCWNYESS